MKIVKIENNSGKWFDLNTEVGVKTNEGVKKSNKLYFNGFEPIYKVIDRLKVTKKEEKIIIKH